MIKNSTKASILFIVLAISAAFSEDIRSIDGSGNNAQNPDWGKAGIPLVREDASKTSYVDGFSTPDASLPSARVISNIVFSNNESVTSGKGLTDYATYWGQFLDHDVTASTISVNYAAREYLNITVPAGDPYMDPMNTGTVYMSFGRSNYVTGSGVSGNPRQIINAQSSWIDGSQIYGTSTDVSNILRTMSGGKMKVITVNNEIVPPKGLLNDMENSARRFDPSALFSCGDARCNENPGLLSLHALFLREHNRLADQFASEDPSLTDEQLFQKARKWVIAYLQSITMNEYMAAILGVLPPNDEVYDPTVSPNVMMEFATGAFRYGHSEVNDFFSRLDENYETIAAGNLGLYESYYNPSAIDQGVDTILRGMSRNIQLEVDTKYPDALRNFLFGKGRGGHDLVALNIQRARDQGVPSYNNVRRIFGLTPRASFAEVTSDTDVASKLSEAYGGDIEKCEIYSCGIAEDHFVHESGSTANVGETFFTVINEQYRRMRVGDRFYFSFDNGLFNATEITQIRGIKLIDIIKRNSAVTNLQCSVMTRYVVECPDSQPTPSTSAPSNGIPTDGSLTTWRFGVFSQPTKANPMYGQALYSYYLDVNGNQVETPVLYAASGTNYTIIITQDSSHAWVFAGSLTSTAFRQVNSSNVSRRIAGSARYWWVPNLEADGDTVYYACSLHAYMGNKINIVAPLPSSTTARTSTSSSTPSTSSTPLETSVPSGEQTVLALRVIGNVTAGQARSALSTALGVSEDRIVILNITRVTSKRQDKYDVEFAITDPDNSSVSSRVLVTRLKNMLQNNADALKQAGLNTDGTLREISINYSAAPDTPSISTNKISGASSLQVSFGVLSVLFTMMLWM